MNLPIIQSIALADIEVRDRLRPADASVVASLATDIGERGLRTPIEIAAQKKKGAPPYRLVAGLHRISACRALGWAEIPAIVVSGNQLELRRDEILENLTRSELTKLERAVFLAELKRVYLDMHPEAKHGGDRGNQHTGGKSQDAETASWHEAAAQRSGWKERTLQVAVRIGERLDPAAAEALRGTVFEDNQAELEALTKHGGEIQQLIAARLTGEKPARSVRAALAALQGQPEAVADGGDAVPGEIVGRDLKALLDAWSRSSDLQRVRFIDHLITEGYARGNGLALGWIDPAEAEG